jgi:hypothetical protein
MQKRLILLGLRTANTKGLERGRFLPFQRGRYWRLSHHNVGSVEPPSFKYDYATAARLDQHYQPRSVSSVAHKSFAGRCRPIFAPLTVSEQLATLAGDAEPPDVLQF